MLNKSDIVNRLAEKAAISKKTAELNVNALIEIFEDAVVNEGGVQIIGVATVETVDRKERQGSNPATGEPVIIPAHKTLKIKVGSSLKDKLNGK